MKRKPPLSPETIKALQRAFTLIVADLRGEIEPREPRPKPISKGEQRHHLLDLPEVLEMVPFGKSTLLRMIKREEFPAGRFISPNRRVWYERDVTRWLANLPTESGRRVK
jgi:predicted DNA-binding transcriptional regulator AlpA